MGRFRDITGAGMTAVIIDTGIDVDHPFFGPDADHNGVADRIVFQYDFADHDIDASDRSGHGSHIASLIGSQDAVYTGVAPDANLIALKVFSDTGTGTFAYVEEALQWVVAHAVEYHINVVNLSLGDGQNWTTPGSHYGLGDEFATLANDGIIVVAAAGNSFFTASSMPGVSYPAADPNVIGVGAVWTQDFGGPWRWSSGAIDLTTGANRITSFSQRDATMTEIFAPGARLTGANQLGGIVTMQGTSQAAAYLSGTALLAQQIAEDELGLALTPQEFTTLVTASGQRIVDGDNEQDNVTNTGFTFPRVDMVALADAILALRPERHDHQWDEQPGRGVEQALEHRSATGDQHAQGPRFSMTCFGENDHAESPRPDWDSLGNNTSPMSLAQGYTQQAWVRDFVAKGVSPAEEDEELLISLPG
jgi:subtilisin family serine protease